MTNHIKAKIDNIQQNCKLCGDRNETLNYIISKCSTLPQDQIKDKKIRRVLCTILSNGEVLSAILVENSYLVKKQLWIGSLFLLFSE